MAKSSGALMFGLVVAIAALAFAAYKLWPSGGGDVVVTRHGQMHADHEAVHAEIMRLEREHEHMHGLNGGLRDGGEQTERPVRPSVPRKDKALLKQSSPGRRRDRWDHGDPVALVADAGIGVPL